MVDQIKIVSARRAYEFAPDDIRLTLVATKEVIKRIEEAFAFKTSLIAEPMATFGPVPKTLPPGVIFNWGSLPFPEGKVAPLRFLHFEQRRVVFDVAGPSSVIDLAFLHLQQILSDIYTPDNWPAMGIPTSMLDWSEIAAHLDFDATSLLATPLQVLYSRVLGLGSNSLRVLAPVLRIHTVTRDSEYLGSPTQPTTEAFSLEIRKGTAPSAGIYYSSVPLNTDAHKAYLDELERILTSNADDGA